jgi:outer membrane cobalamin receptor
LLLTCLVVASPVAATAGTAQVSNADQTVVPRGGDLSGVVLDPSGAPIPGALVRLDRDGVTSPVLQTSASGEFLIVGPATAGLRLLVTAPGFRQAVIPLAGIDPRTTLRVVLQPERVTDAVTVTASLGVEEFAAPASTTVITAAEVFASGGAHMDDVLRNTPGFSLNRRSSSRATPPPAQGVALRGIPGIGASRTLVLADGLPLNDPFGGWVVWNRVPVAAIDRVEVLRGPAGDLYGADAMGGVIQLLTFAPGPTRVRGLVEGGSASTARTSLFASTSRGVWRMAAAGEWEDTGGYIRIPAADRGPVDRAMTDEYRTGFASLGYVGRTWSAEGRASGYTEHRQRGTPLLVDDTTWRQLSGSLVAEIGGGTLQARAAGGTQEYFNNFSSITPDRTIERLTTEQRIPTVFRTTGAQWTRRFGRHAVIVGGDLRRTTGKEYETFHEGQPPPSGPILTGGTETAGSAFARASLSAGSRVTLVFGARGDHWRSRPIPAGGHDNVLRMFTPSAAVIWRALPAISLRVGVARAYRTPTLDELSRSSRQGNVLTMANPLLRPERLTGVEGGLLWTRARTAARVTGFVNVLDDMVTNVTQSSTPLLIVRRKANVDRARAAGVEIEADFRPTGTITLTSQAMIVSSRFVGAPESSLSGKRTPQMPRYQAGAGVTWSAPLAVALSLQWRVTGAQFDDDRNTLKLGAFSVLDASVSRQLHGRLHVYLAVENMFDVEYEVGRTPNRWIGLPRTIRTGFRTFLP